MLVTLNDVLKKAQKEHYAVGLFNSIDSDMLEGVISAAEEMESPIIIGTAEVLLPYGELKLIAPSVIAAADRAKVPVVVHYDHGLTFQRCMEALQLGFTSIMFDGSTNDNEKNLEEKIDEIEKKIPEAARDFVKLNELTAQKEAAEKELDEKMARWMYLEDLAARIEAGEMV